MRVAPGPIWTPLNPSGGQPKEKIPEFGKDTPMGRPGQPNEVAPCFLFLACEDSSYMTGPGASPRRRQHDLELTDGVLSENFPPTDGDSAPTSFRACSCVDADTEK